MNHPMPWSTRARTRNPILNGDMNRYIHVPIVVKEIVIKVAELLFQVEILIVYPQTIKIVPTHSLKMISNMVYHTIHSRTSPIRVESEVFPISLGRCCQFQGSLNVAVVGNDREAVGVKLSLSIELLPHHASLRLSRTGLEYRSNMFLVVHSF